MKIAIDAGHGRYTAGKRCAKQFDTNQTREWVLNNRVAKKVISALKTYQGVEILRVDDATGNLDIGLTARCNKANNWGADIYLSIHHNAGGGVGIETFRHTSQSADSQSGKLATAIHNAIVSSTGNRNRGVKQFDFAVCRQTHMPAILTELGFMDNAEDTPRILTEEYATKATQGIVNGIVGLYHLSGGNNQPRPEPETPVIPEKRPEPQPTTQVDVFYRVKTKKHGWLPDVKNLEDYAGYEDSPITDIAIRVDKGTIKYRAHVKGGKWLPWVDGYGINDHNNGYAGNGKEIDAIEVYYNTPDNIRPYQRAVYRVAPVKGNYYDWQHDSETTGKQDGYAGAFGKSVGKVQICIE